MKLKKSQLKLLIKTIIKESLLKKRKKFINENLSPKNQQLIEKWIKELGLRKAAIRMVDSVLSKIAMGMTSLDLPDTATFANGIDEIEGLLTSGNFPDALKIAVETAKNMIEEEGGIMEGDESDAENDKWAGSKDDLRSYEQNPKFTKAKKINQHVYKVGDKVKLKDDVLNRHSKNIPAHAGYTTTQFQWRNTLEKLLGKIGTVDRIFKNSKHINVKFDNVVIGIDSTELNPA